ncbi:hypothetical protein RB594_007528 [Gaeumannomyces avenae]
MHCRFLVSALLAVLSIGAQVHATPVACPDDKRDAILRGALKPEACCSYGRCKGDVVVAMD